MNLIRWIDRGFLLYNMASLLLLSVVKSFLSAVRVLIYHLLRTWITSFFRVWRNDGVFSIYNLVGTMDSLFLAYGVMVTRVCNVFMLSLT